MKATPEQVGDALRASLKEAERLRQQNRRLHEAASEPIAIVGMSCRYPGGVRSPDEFWDLLAAGGDAVSEFPTDRGWDLEAIHDPDTQDFGTSYTRQGGFVYDAADFDPGFFGISPREALGMDPQQRLLLEAAWEALEDAGVDPRSLRGTQTGVFAGAMYHDYGWGLNPARESAAYLATGGSSSLVSGRISYTLGFEGPAISVDTACSSSLVALHLAAHALRAGECSLALAGGATVYSTPGVFIQFSGQRILSPDGRCKAYAEAADGAGFSEGAGMLLLERLSDARRHGHPVLATIRGSAVNQDGASNGLTAPNGPSQERVIRRALDSAQLDAGDVDAVEGHGTGTGLGDPIEAKALLATYGVDRPRGRPLHLGSVKSNIGHAQAAAGVGGVIKMVLAMREGVLPRTLHVDAPSSKVEWSTGRIELLTEPLPWETDGRPRRAGVSSFGATGTNAHLILEEAPAVESAEEVEAERAAPGARPSLPGVVLLPLSAKTGPALREAASRLASHLRRTPHLDPVDVGYSLTATRSTFEQRAVAVGAGREELLAALAALERGESPPDVVEGRALAGGKVVFLFPGQGSQWEGMALGLLDSAPVFAGTLRQCGEALERHTGWSVEDVLRRASGAPSLERVEVVQPALFAVTVALAELWRSCGVQPAAVVGHSQGEIAAAHVAGGLVLEDAARLVAVRSRLIAGLAGQGGMISVSLSADRLAPLLARWEGRIEVAAINGPSSTVASGERQALDELLEQCAEDGVRARQIPAGVTASHSAYIEVLRDELLEAVASTSPRAGEIPFHSTVTGGLLDTTELDAEYWYRNMREPVRFEHVVRGLLGQGRRTLMEVSPHPVLNIALEETIADALPDPGEAAVLETLRRDEGGRKRFALSLAAAHTAGADVDWEAFFEGTGAKPVRLPTYPFQRKRYWLNASMGSEDVSSAGLASAEHPLLGATVESPEGEGLSLVGRLSLQSHRWLEDHAVDGTVLLPGTAFLELALRAGREVDAPALDELTLQAPLILTESGSAQIQVTVAAPDEEGRRAVAIHSRPEGADADLPETSEWTCHAQGILSTDPHEPCAPLGTWPPEGAEPLEVEALYERLADLGFEYGPAFQGVVAAWRSGDELFVEVSLPDEQAQEAERFAVHPALLDAAGHAGIDLALNASAQGAEPGEPSLPFAWSGVGAFRAGGSSLRVRLSLERDGGGLTAFDEAGDPVVAIDSVVLRPVDPSLLRAAGRRLPLHRLEWLDFEPRPSQGPDRRPLAILGEVEVEGLAAERYADLATLVEAIAQGAPAPAVVIATAGASRDGSEGVLEAAHLASAEILDLAQGLVGEEALEDTRLCLLTGAAVAVGDTEAPELAAAPLWGLLRSIQSEHPGRFALIDTDGSEASQQALAGALEAVDEEPQVALREGTALAPRLARTAVPEAPVAAPIDQERTVLVTGGTSGIGARVARHLAEHHGARHLLLVSRSGEEAQGSAELKAELQAAGAEVTIAACDVSERAQLEALLGSIPSAHPLGVVIHSAAVLDDGVLQSLDPERLLRVMRPKADAAWHLHELTVDMELSAFVLFSSVMGILGGAAQANYAAANTFLDALAAHRHARGLPATSLAWGGWAQTSGMIDGSDGSAELERLAQQVRERLGLVPMPPDQGLDLLDAALAFPEPLLAPVAFDKAVLRRQASSGMLPAILRGLVRAVARPPGGAGSLERRLASVPEAERPAVVLELVQTHVAAVLGHASVEAVDPSSAFKDLGFDSLGAVELRNRLVAATGLRLAPTIVFDYPSTAALAAFLHAEIEGEVQAAGVAPRLASSTDEPIAVVGMACRYPGGVASPQELWGLVAAETDAISGFPEDRGWDLDRLYHPDPDHPGTSYAREGGFVHDAAGFDPGFFGISPREALVMDPQERALLEACWEALEDAGINPHELRGSQTGVFAGVMYQDYGTTDHGTGPGMTSSGVSGRVAYTFGLEGPAMTIDTACSSSLVAMHLAAQALRGGECSLALAGGVTVLSTPAIFTFFSRQRGLAADGRCKAFADSADGTGVSEGTGVVLLERLSDAQRNGHPVLATIRGSAVNQDGASNGFTAPNGPSQERVIRQALASAGLRPQEVDAVEAHGTGTSLGDPIEAGALLATYGREREQPLRLGSIKSNIGHTQAAAGVAGVIKTVLAMRERVLPRTLHVSAPSSSVDWSSGEIELLTEPQPWQANGRPRRAAVSSFGASGTNAHMILEEAPQDAGPDGDGSEEGAPVRPLPGPIPLPLSARTEPALRDVAARLASRFEAEPDLDPVDAAYSLAAGRAVLEHRAVVLGADRGELMSGLAALQRGDVGAGVLQGRTRPAGKLAYLFTGQGSQRPGMGRELHDSYPAFASAFDEACEHFDPHLGASLAELVFGEGEETARLLADTTYAQPALFAIEVALFRLLESLGLVPDLLAGHSIGELSAAHVAGVLSLPEAAALVAARGRLMGALPSGGAMLAVQATEEEAMDAIDGNEASLSVAALNGPSSVVLSGDEGAIAEARKHWEAAGRKTKRLTVSHAFHSPLIEPMLAEFQAVAAGLDYGAPRLPIVSNLTGKVLTPEEAADPAYWVRHARAPVRFGDAVATLRAKGARAFLELGPDAVLGAMARECLQGDGGEAGEDAVLEAVLRDGRPEPWTLVRALSAIQVQGTAVDWSALFEEAGATRVPLPTYPFQRKRYWLTSEAGQGSPSSAGQAPAEHPLLGASIALAGGDGRLLTGRLSVQSQPWLADHVLAGMVLLPGTAFVELALRAGEEVGATTLEELAMQAPLVLPEKAAVQLQVSLAGPDEDGRREVSIYSRPAGDGEDGLGDDPDWTCHAQGILADPAPASVPEPPATWPPADGEPLEVDDLYERLGDLGVELGPAFQGVRAAWRRGEELFVELSLPEEHAGQAERFGLHPALFDSTGHVGIDLALAAAAGERRGDLLLPFAWRGVRLLSSGASTLRVRASFQEGGGGLVAFDESGEPVVSVDSLVLRPVDPSVLEGAAGHRRPLHRLEWVGPEAHGAGGRDEPRLAILAERDVDGLEGQRYPDLPTLLEAIAGGAPVPAVVLADARAGRGEPNDLLAATHAAAGKALGLLQAWVSEGRLEHARLCLLTERAVAVAGDDDPELRSAPIWGLVRSAQSEHPDRLALIDSDDSGASRQALAAAVALGAEEPQVALRDGAALVPRLVPFEAAEASAAPIDPQATVLITGGTSGLGALVARHLASQHDIGHLLLVSRRGQGAEGAVELEADLRAAGAEVTIAACDVSQRAQLEELLGSIPSRHPLGAVIHSAGILDDGVLESLDRERLERVMRAKADAAWHLHELTEESGLSQFVMFSSAAGILGTPGQANYTAANVFLDTLAALRRAQGRPALSLAWGGWLQDGGMTGGLSDADLARVARLGLKPIPPELGLELFDVARTLGEASLAPIGLDRGALRAQASAGTLPVALRGLVRSPSGQSRSRRSLAERLARVPEPERHGTVLELVRTHVAAVLGHTSIEAIEPESAFSDLGFDSLAAVELRNRLNAATGLRLPPTLVFDYPSAETVAEHLLAKVAPDVDGKAAEGETEGEEATAALTSLTAMLPSIKADDRVRDSVSAGLRSLLVELSDLGPAEGDADDLASMSHEEMFELIDSEIGAGEGD